MHYREALNSEDAAELLGNKAVTIRNYARHGVIPGKRLGKEWRCVKNSLLAWLKDKDMDMDESELKPPIASAGAFLIRFRDDDAFRQKVESYFVEADLMAFVQQEGFFFTLQELDAVIKAEMNDDVLGESLKSWVVRRAQRYQVYLKVSELNGQPVTDTMIIDINAWGARIGSLSPFEAPGIIEITFTPPGESQNVHLSGEVVWSRLMPADSQYHAGVEFSKPIDQLHREGKI
jgi:hypothetical protein